MNRDETLLIMGVLKVAYPAYYRDIGIKDAKSAVGLWHAMFADKPYSLVDAAVKSFIASDTKGFPPTIGMICEEISKLFDNDSLTELEAWELVKRAASNSSYGHEYDSFEALPQEVRRIVGSPQTLHEWGQMDINEFNTVVASNFMRSYRARCESVRRETILPSSVKSVVSSLADKMTLKAIGGETDE